MGMAGFFLAYMEEFNVSFENSIWFLSLMFVGLGALALSIGANHKTMATVGSGFAMLAGYSFLRMGYYIAYATGKTVGAPMAMMFFTLILGIFAFGLLLHALPDDDMPAEPAETE